MTAKKIQQWWDSIDESAMMIGYRVTAPKTSKVKPAKKLARQAPAPERVTTEAPSFNVGDTVCVHTVLEKGGEESIQKFTGVVISLRGAGMNTSFTVRRISYGEGVERVFPVHSPRVAKIVVETQCGVRRTKLNHLRNRTGKPSLTAKEKQHGVAMKVV